MKFLVLLVFIWQGVRTEGGSREIDILWDKYGDVRADVETIQAQLGDFKEELSELKDEVQRLKAPVKGGGEDEDIQVPTTPTINPFTPIQLKLHSVSMTTSERGDSVVFIVDYQTPELVDVDWRVDYDEVFDGNTEFVKATFPHHDYYRSTLTAHIQPEVMLRRRVNVYFTRIPSVQPVYSVRLTVSFNTSEISDKTDSGIMGLYYDIETDRSEKSLQKTLTFVPDLTGLEYEARHLYCSYAYLKESNNTPKIAYAVSMMNIEQGGGISTQNITETKDAFKVLVTLNTSLEQYGGDMYADVGFYVKGNAVDEITAMIYLPYVFTDGRPVDSLQGKFAIQGTRYREMDAGGTGYIYCSALGYPPPVLQIVRLNADNTTRPFSYREARSSRLYHHSAIVISIPNVTKEMEGNYACIAVAGSGTKKEVFHVDVSVPGKFDRAATRVTKYSDGMIAVNVSATGEPLPEIFCGENEKNGYGIQSDPSTYSLVRLENQAENRVNLNIEFNSVNNGTRYEPLYRFVCVVERNYNVEDQMTINF